MSLAQKEAQTERAIQERKTKQQTYYGPVVNYQLTARKTGEKRGRVPHIFKKRITTNLEQPLSKDFQDYLDAHKLTIKQGLDKAIERMIYS